MPHFELRYSRNFEAQADVPALCSRIAAMMRADPMFSEGGIRVRAVACDSFAIADEHPENSFLDMTLRIGAGRSGDAKKATGERLFSGVTETLNTLFDRPHFMLSFEIQEIDPTLSWKKNSIHARLRDKSVEK